MSNPYLNEKLTQAHYQDLFHEAEQQRMLIQLSRRHSQLMPNVARQLTTFLRGLPFFTKKLEQSARPVTSQL